MSREAHPAAAVEQDVIEPCKVRIRHPLECRPHRPEPRPAWSPGYRDRRDAGSPRQVSPENRRDPRLVAARNLGAVRINFRYASFQSMTAAHSEKAGRDQYFEGPHETYGFRLHEVLPLVLDLQYQPLELEWFTPAGFRHYMTFDWGVETQTHGIVFGEDKASDEFYDDPHLSERLDFAEAFLADRGASFQRRVAGGLPSRLKRNVVKGIFDARRTKFEDDQAARVRALVLNAGGTAPLGQVLQAIGGHPALSLDIARAMMHRRVLSIPISAPPMRDTPVTIPPIAEKGALRAFLARHVLADPS